MSELSVSSRPQLRRPVLVAAFRGWNDGGQGASLGGGYLAKQWSATRFAEIDPEVFYDFQATRPHVSLVDGPTRHLDWPDNGFFYAPIPGTDRDAILLLGTEPNLRWRTFTGLVLELAKDLGVELLVTLGSLLADVPHTRPAPVTGAATDPALVEQMGLEPSLRGADRHRRRRARRLPRRGHRVRQPVGGGAPLRVARPEPACGAGARAALRRADRRRHRARRARAGVVGVQRAGERSRLDGCGDGAVRRGARAARRHARGRGRPAVGRVPRGRADALPARTGRAGREPGRRRRPRRLASSRWSTPPARPVDLLRLRRRRRV